MPHYVIASARPQDLVHLPVIALAAAQILRGFAQVEVIETNAAHLEEIDVLPDHGRRGLGARLVMHVCRWAALAGYNAVTLTTFRDVPWNRPFYERLGFREIPQPELSPALCAVVQDETRRGLDPASRVVMRRPSGPIDDAVKRERAT